MKTNDLRYAINQTLFIKILENHISSKILNEYHLMVQDIQISYEHNEMCRNVDSLYNPRIRITLEITGYPHE